MPRPLRLHLVVPVVTLALALGAWTPVSAAAPNAGGATSTPLFDQLAALDQVLFDSTFADCDPEPAIGLFTEDVEFYHDKSGFDRGDAVRQSIRNLAKDCPAEKGVTRELLEESLRVYPLGDYGAIQMGTHHFVEKGASTFTTAEFVHLWMKVGDAWKLARVLSFDHRSLPVEERR